jgi:serine phosphatase RsbU (regulator of sigma subunit)
MLLNLTDMSNASLYEQISFQIIEKILEGELKSGDELNSIGYTARQQRVSKLTVSKAYKLLSDLEVIEFKNQMGYFVSDISSDEIKKLRDILKSSSVTYPNFISAKNEKEIKNFENELEVARQIQADLLPAEILYESNFEIAAYIEPSKIVCGDFYDYFRINEKQMGLVIADACGKGMPAAILISQIQAILKSEISNGSYIQNIFKKLNNYLVHNTSNKNFTTLFYAVFDIEKNTLKFSNAGHNYPILIRSNGSIELLKTTGPALGLIPNFNFQTNSVTLLANDLLLFYTDGINETMNMQGEQFGEGRLIELLLNNRKIGSSELIKTIVEEVQSFRAESNLADDKTLMILKVNKMKEVIECS